ncbi:hypothetical protein CERSUDRAFT_116992 [Gelatoporia subvermispora B]|uniref:RRM domain-containing protein n=1 Tax=Ceriporiopsis subvermispora (strain B) TaxID=914234 RepID=M2QCR6_CERS8|nr:hypothetical protein CERSUDRAFT_116992 [Gelatoporia subvermispora B]
MSSSPIVQTLTQTAPPAHGTAGSSDTPMDALASAIATTTISQRAEPGGSALASAGFAPSSSPTSGASIGAPGPIQSTSFASVADSSHNTFSSTAIAPDPPENIIYTSSQSSQTLSLASPQDESASPTPTAATFAPSARTNSSPVSSTSVSSTSSTSTLSVNAPQFQSRLNDAPIDIHGLVTPPHNASPAFAQNGLGATAPGASAIEHVQTRVHVPGSNLSLPYTLPPASQLPDAPQVQAQVPSVTHEQPQTRPQAQAPATLSTFAEAQPQPQPQPQGGGDHIDVRTPNVYINGLPPNFAEEQLLAMTREFGEVISVRTFTRHVSDRPSGYGFVLFETVEAAEKCIETLRKYRNLHPSFSKQIHKIPGTPYASATTLPALTPADSFKARMEQLRDLSSTNLYIEGLPLSIDEPTLSALVRPYRIMSSRFFQTRLSSPPRIIAFVRLETRTAAEEVIERLHGRMVRGWNDTGCRISVRFADTSEQRELRRMERLTREGENSPSRITMAQAALLNLKGTQLHSPQQVAAAALPSPNFGLLPGALGGAARVSPELGQLAARAAAAGIPFPAQGRTSMLGSATAPELAALLDAQALSRRGVGVRAVQDGLAQMQMQLAMGLEGAQLGAMGFEGAQQLAMGLDAQQLAMGLEGAGLENGQAQMQLGMGLDAGQVSAPTGRAHGGFTAVERLLLQAHVQRQQQLGMGAHGRNQQQLGGGAHGRNEHQLGGGSHGRDGQQLGASTHSQNGQHLGVSIHGQNAAGSRGVERREGNRRLLDVLPPMSEDDFHSTAAGARRQQTQTLANGHGHGAGQQTLANGNGHGAVGSGLGGKTRQVQEVEQPERSVPVHRQSHQRNQTHALQARADAEAHMQMQALHMRATTLPSQYLAGRPGAQAFGGEVLYGTGVRGSARDGGDGSNSSIGIGIGSQKVNSNVVGGSGDGVSSNSDYVHGNMNSTGSYSNMNLNSIGHGNMNSTGNTNTNGHGNSIGTNQLSSGQQAHNQYHANSGNVDVGSHNSHSHSSRVERASANANGGPHNDAGAHNGAATQASTAPAIHANASGLFGDKSILGGAGSNIAKAAATEVAGGSRDEEVSPLVSPALTYSARTPVTLSPATPFSGFFPHAGETFEGPPMAKGGVAQEGGVQERFEQEKRVVG